MYLQRLLKVKIIKLVDITHQGYRMLIFGWSIMHQYAVQLLSHGSQSLLKILWQRRERLFRPILIDFQSKMYI